MLPDRVSNPGHLTYESGALPIALRGPVFRLPGGIAGSMVDYMQDYQLVLQCRT